MAIQDKAFLDALIASLFADNNSRDITPQDLRAYLQEELDSTWLQRQMSVILNNATVTLFAADIDQNKFFLFTPASGQSQTINLPPITPDMVGRQFMCFFDYSNQIGTFVAAGANTITGKNPVNAAQAIASVRVLDIDRWAINRVDLDPPAFTAAGYGGLVQNSSSFSIGTLTAAWTTFTGWDAVSIATPKDITQNLAGDSIQFDTQGVWTVSVQLTIEHNEENFGRQIGLRVINTTTATPSRAYVFGTGRNQNITNLTIPGSIIQVLLAAEGDDFQIQIGGFDGYTSVDAVGGSFEAVHVSEAQGL